MSISETWHLFGPNYVPYRVLLLAKMIDRVTAKQLRALAGITLAEWRVLAHASVLGEASPSRIGSAAAIDRAEISRAVKMLEGAGLISRRADPNHGKRHLVSLTPRGQAVHQHVRLHRAEFFKDLTVDLDAGDLAKLDEMLLKIALRIEEQCLG